MISLLLKLIDRLGYSARQTFLIELELILFASTTIRRGGRFVFQNEHNGVIRNSIVTQIIFSGVDSLIPTMLLMSIAIGFSVTAQLILTLQTYGSEKEVVNLLIRFVALELSPLLTAIIVICRSGSAVAVDIGNMSINKEIKGLELLGVDVLVYVAFPRLLGIAISQIVLAVYFSSLLIVLGIFFSALLESSANFKYFFILIASITPLELLAFLFKNMLFGIIIGANSCFHGLRVKYSVTEVPQETQQAIIHSLVAIFFINTLFVL
jgi:phospholipid/cholesterol/gamma-HCH transport system permease protein